MRRNSMRTGTLAAAALVLLATTGWWMSRPVTEEMPAAPEAPKPSRPVVEGPAAGFARQLEKSGFEIVDMKVEVSGTPDAEALAREKELLQPITDPTLPRGLVSEAPAIPEKPLFDPKFDPEAQPRGFWMEDFTQSQRVPNSVHTENVVLTARGFELPPAKPGEEDSVRMGVVESTGNVMEFPFNNMTPLWKQDVPDGTSVVVEVAASPDGSNWTDWETITPVTDEISPVYPDGSPNPNYGFVLGGIRLSGSDLYHSVRYRVTLYTESGASPALGAMRFYIQDNTMGEGRLAQVNAPQQDGPVTP